MGSEHEFDSLREAAMREIERGLTACQLAVGRHGKVVYAEGFGRAATEVRFAVASATKPIVASAIWLLIGDGTLDIQRPVADYIPEFAEGGKDSITVEQVLVMTCGLSAAEMGFDEGVDAERRRARMATWQLEHEPGTRYVYHGLSAHWVMADLIERLTGTDFRDFVEERVTRPQGLPRLLGIPRAEQGDVIQLASGSQDQLLDYAGLIEAGVPGGGGCMTASSLAQFYQGLLHNPGGLWDAEALADGTSNVRCTLPDPLMNLPANRTTGVVVGAGFGATWSSSETAFGWPGAGGQVGFADPATGISFAFLQTGDPDQASQFLRGVRMSKRALALGR